MKNIKHIQGGWLTKLGWLLSIWMLSVTALGVLSYCMRYLMHAAGLTL